MDVQGCPAAVYMPEIIIHNLKASLPCSADLWIIACYHQEGLLIAIINLDAAC